MFCFIPETSKIKRVVSSPMKTKQSALDSELELRRQDLSCADSIAEVIALLRDENDRLRQMAELLSAETEYMRRSRSPAKTTDWRPSTRLRTVS
jgi:hypothetical protein